MELEEQEVRMVEQVEPVLYLEMRHPELMVSILSEILKFQKIVKVLD